MPSMWERRARMNKHRESAWRPTQVFADGSGGVEKHGMAEIFQACRDQADHPLDIPEDIVFLEDEAIPGATLISEGE